MLLGFCTIFFFFWKNKNKEVTLTHLFSRDSLNHMSWANFMSGE